MQTDTELLRRFSDDGDQEAFAELVQSKIDLVYAAALRQTRGDAYLARDVTQGVFLALASQAATLKRHAVLTGWLYTTTRFVATKAVRTQARWQRREREANTMTLHAAEPTVFWSELRPVIDDAMGELDEKDRTALLLRFFEGRSLADVGAAIELAENSARMRVERALDKLRERLVRHGITSTAAALGVALANQPAVALPADITEAIFTSSLAGAAIPHPGFAPAWGALDLMTKLKIACVAASTLVAVGTGAYLIAQPSPAPVSLVTAQAATSVDPRVENQQLRAEIARLEKIVVDSTPSPLADLRALVSAVKQRVIPPLVNVLRTTNGKLPLANATLFNLTAEEKTALETELETMRASLEDLALRNIAAVERPSPASIVIRFNLYPAEGGKVHDRLLAELTRVLRAERYSALVTLMGDRFDSILGSTFGAGERSLTIERVPGGLPDRPRYRVTDRAQLPGATTSLASVVLLDRASIERDYPAAAKNLPADF